jgi:hypothetical protein
MLVILGRLVKMSHARMGVRCRKQQPIQADAPITGLGRHPSLEEKADVREVGDNEGHPIATHIED